MKFTNMVEDVLKTKTPEKRVMCEAMRTLVLLMSPMAPHITAEIWEMMAKQGPRIDTMASGSSESSCIYDQRWPQYDPLIADRRLEDNVQLVVQIDGKVRAKVPVHFELLEGKDTSAIVDFVVEQTPSLKQRVFSGSTSLIDRVIFVPPKLLNITLKKK